MSTLVITSVYSLARGQQLTETVDGGWSAGDVSQKLPEVEGEIDQAEVVESKRLVSRSDQFVSADAGDNIWTCQPNRLNKLSRPGRLHGAPGGRSRPDPVGQKSQVSADYGQSNGDCFRRVSRSDGKKRSTYNELRPTTTRPTSRPKRPPKRQSSNESFRAINGASRMFRCKHCKKRFAAYSSLHFHTSSHAKSIKKRRRSCRSCLKIFPNALRLLEHTKSECCKTGGVATLTYNHYINSDRPFGCRECYKCYYNEGYLLRHHNMMHTGQQPYSCEHCGQRFRFKMQHETHIRRWRGRCTRSRYSSSKHHGECRTGRPKPETKRDESKQSKKKQAATSKSKARGTRQVAVAISGSAKKLRNKLAVTDSSELAVVDGGCRKKSSLKKNHVTHVEAGRRCVVVGSPAVGKIPNGDPCRQFAVRQQNVVVKNEPEVSIGKRQSDDVIGKTNQNANVRNLFRAYSEWRANVLDKSSIKPELSPLT